MLARLWIEAVQENCISRARVPCKFYLLIAESPVAIVLDTKFAAHLQRDLGPHHFWNAIHSVFLSVPGRFTSERYRHL
jgi:hypothetical protein